MSFVAHQPILCGENAAHQCRSRRDRSSIFRFPQCPSDSGIHINSVTCAIIGTFSFMRQQSRTSYRMFIVSWYESWPIIFSYNFLTLLAFKLRTPLYREKLAAIWMGWLRMGFLYNQHNNRPKAGIFMDISSRDSWTKRPFSFATYLDVKLWARTYISRVWGRFSSFINSRPCVAKIKYSFSRHG